MIQCLILAGGQASRLRPVSDHTPKILLPIGDRPFVDRVLAHLASKGVTDVVLSLGRLGEQVQRHVGNGNRWGLSIRCLQEGEQALGTAGALRFAYDQGVLSEAFLVMYGDTFLPIDFSSVFYDFLRSPYPACMTVYENADQIEPSNVWMHPERMERVGRYEKDPLRRIAFSGAFRFIDFGLSVFRRGILEGIPRQAPCELSDWFARWSEQGILGAQISPHRFYEIGSFRGLSEFQELWKERPCRWESSERA
jgi:NDP-sugar pyrophosphorylase family protein